MQIASIILIVVVAIVAVILSSKVRGIVLDAVQTAWDFAAGAVPTSGEIWTVIRPVIWTILAFTALGLVASLIVSGLVLALGIRGNAWFSATLIIFFFPIWYALRLFKPRKLSGEPRRNIIWRFLGVPYRIVSLVLLIALPFFLIGVWSPEVKEEIDEAHGDVKFSIADRVRKWRAQSAKQAGNEGWIGLGRDLQMMTTDAEIETVVPGTRVFVMILNKVPASKKGQGLTQVMLRDENGYFRDGKIGLVPSKRIVWKPIVVVEGGGVRQLDL